MTRRTIAAYVALFRYIERNVCSLDPSSFMSDYEVALRKALRTCFPGVPTRACWFHFKQAVRRNVAKMPLFAAEIKEDQHKYRLYDKFLALPLLPHVHIDTGFRKLKDTVEHTDSEQFAKFIQYFESQWIKKVRL